MKFNLIKIITSTLVLLFLIIVFEEVFYFAPNIFKNFWRLGLILILIFYNLEDSLNLIKKIKNILK